MFNRLREWGREREREREREISFAIMYVRERFSKRRTKCYGQPSN